MFTTLPERDQNRLSKFGYPFAKRFYTVLLFLLFCAVGSYAQHTVSTTLSHGATSYPVPAKVKRVDVDVWGAGGGGGGVDGGSSDTRGSGGGAGGAFKRTTNVTVTPSSSVTVTIGTGGTGGTGANAGGPGGATTFSSAAPVSADGGAGGGFANSADNTGSGAPQTTSGSPTAIGGAGGTAPGGTDATASGGGGAAGGPLGPGGDASGQTAGNSPHNDIYDGAAGRTTVGNGDPAPGIGGGGAGGRQVNSNTNMSGGNGGHGQIIVSYTLPTGIVSINDADGYVKNGQVVRITVIFSEAVADAPVPQLALSGLYAVAMANMTKVSTTEYYLDHTVQTGNGTLTVSLGTAEAASGGNVVHDVPTAGATFTVDNTAPTLTITRNAVTLGSFSRTTDQNISFNLQFSEPLTASTFDITDIAVVKDVAVGHSAIIGTDLVNIGDNTNYVLTIRDVTGDGNIGISVGPNIEDRASNAMAAAQNSANFTMDNTPPLITSINRATSSPTNANDVDFNVAFDENVVNVGTNDFTIPVTSSAVGTLNGISGTGMAYVVSISSVDGNGTLGLNAKDLAASVTIADEAGNAFVAGFTGQTYTIDNQVPTVSSVVRASTNPTNAANVDYTVTFDEPVTNVGTDDFTVATTAGTATGAVNSVSGTGATYTVNVNALAGTGKIRLNVKDLAATVTIQDLSTNAFAAGFTTGQEYDVDRDIPTVISVNRVNATPTNATSVDYSVVFSESVNGVEDTDFSIVTVSGTVTGGITAITGSGANYTVTVGTLTGDGEFRLDVKTQGGGATIQDAIGNAFTAGFTGQVYERDATAPSITSLVSNASTAGALIIGQSITFTATLAVAEPGLTFAPTTAGYNGENISWSSSDGGATYTATYTISSGDTDQTTPLQLTGVTATDDANNTSNTAATVNVAKTIDANAPASPAATVATLGGTIRAGYYNISNTDIQFTVPIPTNGVDPSLLNGNVQVLIDNQTDAGFITLGAATMIGVTDQGSSMLITIPDATIIANGKYANGNTLKFRVRITDASGNQTTTATLGTQLVVDRTAPTTPSGLALTAATDSYGGATGSLGTNSDRLTNSTNPVITGSGENGSTVTLVSSLSGDLTSGNVSSGSFSIGAGNIIEGAHEIRARAEDAAGNVSGLSATGFIVTIDRTAPTRGQVSFTDVTGQRAFILIEFSEDIDLAENAVPVINTTTGFTASVGSIQNDGTTRFDNDDNTLVLERGGGTEWTQAGTTWTYTNSGSAAPSTSNYIKDRAGNEMITGGFNSSDVTPPALASGLVFNPNGSGAEIVTFEINETLSLAEGAAVTGFSSSMGSIGSAIYSDKGGTNTITLTSGGNGQWTDAVTFSYSLTGNVTDASSNNNELGAFAGEPILIRSLVISENNVNAVGYAKVGDAITLSFFASRPLTPTATIGGLTATIGGVYPNFTASVTSTAAIADGAVTFQITATEASKVTLVPHTTDASTVIFDKTVPVISPVSIASNNANGSTLAKPGNTITLSFTVNETLGLTPTVTIEGRAASVSNVGLNYTATLVLDGSEPAGVLDFNISVADIPRNAATATAITTGSNVTYDKTAPTVQSITLNDSPPHNTGSVTFDVVFSENVTNFQTSDIVINGTGAAGMIGITGSNANYVVTLSQISLEGTLGITIVDDNLSIEDAFDNRLVNDFPSATYNVTVPEPTADPAGFAITAISFTSMTLSWTDVNTYPLPNGYFITIERSGDVASAPVDGNSYADQLDLINNTTGAVHVAQGIQSVNLTLLSGQTYTFKIYPYTNAGANRVYKTNTPGSDSDATPIATTGRLTPSSAVAATIPSTTTLVFSPTRNKLFRLWDDNLGPDNDNAKTIFSSMTFTPGPENSIPNWEHVIAEAELRETSTGQTVTTLDINPASIVFSGIPYALASDMGQIADDAARIYELRIKLRAPLDNTAGIRALIDGLRFEFLLDSDNGIGYEPGSSEMQGGQIISSDPANANTNNTVTVAATHVGFATQPTNALLGIDMSPTVQIEATDAQGNRDLNYNDAGTITSTGVLKFDGVTYFNPVNFTFSSGLASATINHVTRGTGFTLTPNSTPTTIPGPALTTAASNTFDINVSNQSDIVLDNTFTEPTNILYTNYQATDITNSVGTGSIEVGRFTVRDGGAGLNDADAAWTILSSITFNVTNHQAIRKIAIYDEFGNEYQELPAAATVTFNSLWFGSGFWVQDNSFAKFIIRVSFQNSPAFITDNSKIELTIADVQTVSVESSHFVNSTAGTGATTSTAGTDNQIEVVASKYVFTTAPTATVFVNVPFSPAPLVVEARDANEVLDLDYNTAITVTNAGGVKMTDTNNPVAATSINDSFVAGVLTFESDFRYAERGNGNGRLNIAPPPAATPFNSAAIAILISNSSDIIEEASFNYPDNITYIDYQATDIDPTSAGDEIEVAQFTLRDDAGVANADLTETELTSLKFNVTNHGFVKRLALYVGTTEIKEVAVTSNTVTFDAFNVPVEAADQGTVTLRLFATFNTANITDNAQVTFTVSEALTNPNKSAFAALNAGGATTTLTGDDNKMEVEATFLHFLSPVGATNASLNTPFAVSVEARDVNANRDLDFNEDITHFDNTGGLTMEDEPDDSDPANAFVSGFFAFNPNFRYTSDDGGTIGAGTLEIEAGGLDGVSPSITVRSSFESSLEIVQTPTDVTIDYINYQGTAPGYAVTAGNSFVLANLTLYDGDDNLVDNLLDGDSDGANTVLSSFTVSITNPSNIRKVALFDASNNIIVGTEQPAAATVTFSGLSITATDINTPTPARGTAPFTIRAIFMNDAVNVHDGEPIQLRITAATEGIGSKFINGPDTPTPDPDFIGGIEDGSLSPVQNVEVTATQLDFLVHPPSFAGINVPFTVPEVRARDTNAIIDLDQDDAGAAPADGAITTPGAGVSVAAYPFDNGVMAFPGFNYNSVGDGTVTVTTTNKLGASIQGVSNHVDVIHVGTMLAPGGVFNGALAGGATNRVIFGVTFRAPYTVTGNPMLEKFTISFATLGTIVGVFNNIRVFESSSDNIYTAGGTEADVTGPGIGGVITLAAKAVTVDFTQVGGVPRDLNGALNNELTYFLMVDVDPSANASTPLIQPRLEDGGFGSPTDGNIVLSNGSATSALVGTNFSFAAVNAPVVVSSYPARGQLNVAVDQPVIELVYSVPVWTLDGKIYLHDYATGAQVAELPALNGHYEEGDGALVGTASNPLKFSLPVMDPNKLYYISIPQGDFKDQFASDNIGIMDTTRNESPGFSYRDILYFKTAGPNAPRLLTTPGAPKAPSITNMSVTGATFNGIFDQQGKAFYLVVSATSPAPTVDQIKNGANPYAGTVISRGSFDITQTENISQFGIMNGNFVLGTPYHVWVCAESYVSKDHVLTPITTTAPYGNAANSFNVGATGPTMTFTPTTALSSITIFKPNITICSNSYQTLNAPIVVVEGAAGDFNASGNERSFNLLLPSGYQFDDSKTAGVPNYGTVTLYGNDFVPGSGTLSYINNSILRITYKNGGSSSIDNISISGLRVIGAASSPAGNIVRLGGDAFPSIADNTSFATILTVDDAPVLFTNSYSETEYPGREFPITIIPDNFNPTGGNTVRLIPQHDPGDFGSTSFTGTGVNVDQLNLSSATLGIPFVITARHVDNNGCVSENPVQYTVYDHENAIGGLGTQYCIVNNNFPNSATAANQSIAFDNNPTSYMYGLKIGVPSSASPTQTIQNTPMWRSILKAMIVDSTSHFTDFYTYQYNVAPILNAGDSAGIENPYLQFQERSPAPQSNIFYRGGSLGQVEFTAEFRGRVNTQLEFPLKQNVEYFVPAIPIVEVDPSNRSDIDSTDVLNPVTADTPFLSGVEGTPIFCVNGGSINIFGYPRAEGESTGRFVLLNAADGTVLYDAELYDEPHEDPPPAGFTDNGNGTATLDPLVLNNGFNDIRIVYYYQEEDTPCMSSGYLIIRITPNPTAAFTAESVISDETPFATSYCENNPIVFNGTEGSSISSGSIAHYQWNFNDAINAPTEGENQNAPGGDPTEAGEVQHIFKQSAQYNVTLVVTSEFQCKSAPATAPLPISIGTVPTVSYTFSGLSVDDGITFNGQGSVISNSPGINNTDEMLWTFGDGNTQTVVDNFTANVLHEYTTPGLRETSLQVTSERGCRASTSQPIIVLPFERPTANVPYHANFEDGSGGGWQPSSLPTTSSVTNPSSWAYGAPTTSVITLSPAITGGAVWKTNLAGPYNPNERSAIYSPVFDLTQLSRPMVSFNSFTQIESSDGVILQYSVDNLNVADPDKEWHVLGDNIPEGINWFNRQGIAATPGDQTINDYGWSGNATMEWVDSRHALENVTGKPAIEQATQVVFRFALASAKNNFSQLDGFAFDNFRVGNSTRTVLLENFSNTSSTTPGSLAHNETYRNFNSDETGVEIVKIDYHVSFPGEDPFNVENPADPGARALYYGVSTLPQARLDGFSYQTETSTFPVWGPEEFSKRVLELSNATIGIGKPVISDQTMNFKVKFTPLMNMPGRTILHVAVVEQQILTSENSGLGRINSNEEEFAYVLKKMLPNAAGTVFSNLTTGVSPVPDSISFTWETGMLLEPEDDIAIIAFLQDEVSRKVYQAEIYDSISDPSIVTDVEDRNASFKVYPNPADKQMTVELPVAPFEAATLQMFDQMGKVVEQSNFGKGEKLKTIDTSEMAGGVYLIQVNTPKGILRRKVMVLHNN